MTAPAANHPQPHLFAAELLRQGAAGLAALTVERMFNERPELHARYQPHSATKWRENIAARIGYLAAALETAHPDIFARQASWDKAAYYARGGDAACADLELSMRCLRDVIAEELPRPATGTAWSCVQDAIAALATDHARSPSLLSAEAAHGRLAVEYLLAVLGGDRHKACSLIMDAVLKSGPSSAPISVPEVYTHVLGPVQRELGRMWHMNESTVAEEHFATATTHTVISMLYPHLPREPRNGLTALAASVETNAHDIGVRMVADWLEMAGWRSIYLGQNIPAEDLASAVRDFNVDLIALSASLTTHLPVLRETIARVREAAADPGHGTGEAKAKNVKILVGGGAFDGAGEALWRSLGADGYAGSLGDAVSEAGRLCGPAK